MRSVKKETMEVDKCENEEARHILARLEEEFMSRPTIADALRRGREAIKRMEDEDFCPLCGRKVGGKAMKN